MTNKRLLGSFALMFFLTLFCPITRFFRKLKGCVFVVKCDVVRGFRLCLLILLYFKVTGLLSATGLLVLLLRDYLVEVELVWIECVLLDI